MIKTITIKCLHPILLEPEGLLMVMMAFMMVQKET